MKARFLNIFLIILGIGYLLFPLFDPTPYSFEESAVQPEGYHDVFSGFTWGTGFYLSVAYSITLLFGLYCTRPFFRFSKAPLVIKTIASFIVAYVCTVAIARITAFVVPKPYLFYAVYSIIGILIAFDFKSRKSTPGPSFDWGRELKAFAPLVLLFVFLLIFTVAVRESYVPAWYWFDEADHYGPFMAELKADPNFSHFPIFQSHYDHIMYTFLNLSPAPVTVNPVIVFWITGAFLKLSVMFCFYILFERFGLNPKMQVLGAALFFFGPLAFNYSRYYMFFDCLNPFLRTLQGGRILGVVMTLLILTHFFFKDVERVPFDRHTKFIYVLLGLGFPATTLHNFVYTTFFVGFTLVYWLIEWWKETPSRLSIVTTFLKSKFLILVLFVSVIVLPWATYSLRDISLPGIPLLASFGLISITIFLLLWIFREAFLLNVKRLFKTNAFRLFAIFVLTGIFSAKLFGGLASPASVSELLNWFHTRGLVTHVKQVDPLGKRAFHSHTSAQNLFFVNVKIGTFLYKSWSQYDKGGVHFLAYYGLLFIGGFFAFFLLRKKYLESPGSKNNQGLETLNLIFYLLLALGMASFMFFYADFVNDIPANNWVKSRLLEQPFYITLFLLFILAIKSPSVWVRRTGVTIALLQIVVPLFNHHIIPRQIQLSLQYLLERM